MTGCNGKRFSASFKAYSTTLENVKIFLRNKIHIFYNFKFTAHFFEIESDSKNSSVESVGEHVYKITAKSLPRWLRKRPPFEKLSKCPYLPCLNLPQPNKKNFRDSSLGAIQLSI